jgi:hypothetical protein
MVMDSFWKAYCDHAALAIGNADDDGALVITSPHIETARTQMQFALGKAQAWADRVSLQFSANKSKAMIFNPSRKPPGALSTPLLLDGTEIELVEEFKYLGVFVDRKLSWLPHVELKVKKAKKHLMMLNRGFGTT